MRGTKIAVPTFWLMIAVAEAQTPPVLTLDDAVALALTGNRQIQAAALEVDRSREQTAAAKTNRLPQVSTYILGGEALRPMSFTIPKGALGNYAATGPIPGQQSDVTTPQQFTAFVQAQASQPLSQLWKIHLGLIASRISEDLAKAKLRQQRQDTAHSVRDLYYQIAQTQTQIESAEATEKYLAALQGETDRSLTEQVALKGDSLAVRAKLSQQRYQIINLCDTLQTQRETFNHLLGRDLETEFLVEIEPLPRTEETELPTARELALRARPEVQQARLQTKAAENEVRRQRAEYIPDISATFTYISVPNVSFAPQNVLNAGFLLQWQPFDWGQKRHKTQSLRDATKEAALSERDAEQQVSLDVNAKFRALAESRMKLDTSALTQEAEREKLRVMTNRYAEKAALLSDVLQQESAVVEADSDYQKALASFWTAKASFDRALGRE